MENRVPESMSTYEAQKWDRLIAAERSRRKSLRSKATDKVSTALAGAVSAAGEAAKKLPGGEAVADGIDATAKTALSGAAKAIFIPAVASVSLERRVKRLRKQYPELGDADPFVALDLQVLDKRRPRQVIPLVNAATSAGASFAITGAEVATTVSGGATAAVVVGAIAGDVASSLALLGRSIAEVAVHYGYEPSEPEEEVFLMGVLAYSTAGSFAGKTTALTSLSRLVQQMMRQATWKQLEKDVTVRLVQKVFEQIGIKLTHKRLAQVVPVLGGVVSAGLSYDMQNRALLDASRIYRVRRMVDKYGLSFDAWVTNATTDEAAEFTAGQQVDKDPVDIIDVLDHLIEEQSSSLGNAPSGTESD